jgi:hypothetical protein
MLHSDHVNVAAKVWPNLVDYTQSNFGGMPRWLKRLILMRLRKADAPERVCFLASFAIVRYYTLHVLEGYSRRLVTETSILHVVEPCLIEASQLVNSCLASPTATRVGDRMSL